MTPGGTLINEAPPISVLTGLGPGDPIVYASVGVGPGAKERLAKRLLANLAGLSPAWAPLLDRSPLVVEKGHMGRPSLVVGGQPGPAVSFGQAGRSLCAAMAGSGRVGLDVALPQEFAGNYPLPRAFGPTEFAWAFSQCHGDHEQAAALLWTLKEAAVKALGTVFHFHDPREVEVLNPRPWQEGWRVSVRAGCLLAAWVRPQGGGWLAIARD